MIVRRYTPDADAEALQEVADAHDVDLGTLPELGFIVMHQGTAAAFAFLRKVEGAGYMFDSLISNPELNSEQRHEAMTILWTKIIQTSYGQPLIGYATDAGTINRALSTGFIKAPHTILVYKGHH